LALSSEVGSFQLRVNLIEFSSRQPAMTAVFPGFRGWRLQSPLSLLRKA
jgi:hypothetical protein